jgi:hypothetical protein
VIDGETLFTAENPENELGYELYGEDVREDNWTSESFFAMSSTCMEQDMFLLGQNFS